MHAPASHVFWTCPAAKRHWQHLLTAWSNIGAVDNDNSNIWVFGLGLPELPSGAWRAVQQTLTGTEVTPAAREALLPAANELWRYSVATVLHAIWTERLRRMEDPTLSETTHRALAQTGFRRALTRFRGSTYQPGEGEDDQALARVRSALADALLQHTDPPQLQPPQPPVSRNDLYVLFFDGGSRGNPGPGGSGSVIIRLNVPTHAAQVVWVASMAYGSPKTTNNTAEYKGLVHGLRQAKASGFTPLHVVGDSAMVLSQLRMHRSPKKPRLAALYREARTLADDTAVISWAHHYREFNKMADCAANIAMDSCMSTQ
ncbi:reverse transcriptase, partial [Globisporangium polare]